MTTTPAATPTYVLSAQAERSLRMKFDREVSTTFAPNKYIHDGLFEAAWFPEMEDDLLAFLIEAEELTGVKFEFVVKSTRVRIGYAGSWM